MGKAYANRNKKELRPISDFYQTPKSLVNMLLLDEDFLQQFHKVSKKAFLENRKIVILEPACGKGAISGLLKQLPNVEVIEHDINIDNVDFLFYQPEKHIDMIITNPPFSIFDNFVNKAKSISDIVWFIGKTNFFGAYKRYEQGVWNNLEYVKIFNRQADYRSEQREDGKF